MSTSPRCAQAREAKKREEGVRPPEQSIVDAIGRAVHIQQFFILSEFIKLTKFKNNHQNILVAWNTRLLECGIEDDFGVPTSIRAQQRSS